MFRNVRLSRDSQNNTSAQGVGGENSEQDSPGCVNRSMSKHVDEVDKETIPETVSHQDSSTNSPGSYLDQNFSIDSHGSDLDHDLSVDSSGSDLDRDFSTNSPGSDFELSKNPDHSTRRIGPGMQLEDTFYNTAIVYIDKIKIHFQDEPRIYNQFLDIMKNFKEGNICTDEAIQDVTILFSSAPDLFEDFKLFLPEGYFVQDQTDVDSATLSNIDKGSEGRKRKRS